MEPSRSDVLVVGGGVIGAACAHYLSLSGRNVTIIDQGRFGRGCSHANCGLVVPSHVLPLAQPGAVREALSGLFIKNSPVSVKPRLDPALWSWFWSFSRRCNTADMLESGCGRHALLQSSRSLYDQLISKHQLECEWQPRGLLFVYRTPAAMDAFAQTDALLHQEFDISARRIDGEQLDAFEPALKPGLAGGWYYEGDAHLRPDRLLSCWRRLLEERGVRILENCRMAAFLSDIGTACEAAVARAAETTAGELAADQFVLATGAWTPLISGQLGCRIPIQPGKGYSITMRKPAQCPAVPLIFSEDHVAVTPMQSGYRLGSTMEFAGYDATLKRSRLDYLRQTAAEYLHEPYCEPVEEEWFGWRPMTFDGKPIIDRSPALQNVLIAAGHNMLGLSMAPATGKLVAELLSGEPPHLDPAPFRVDRF